VGAFLSSTIVGHSANAERKVVFQQSHLFVKHSQDPDGKQVYAHIHAGHHDWSSSAATACMASDPSGTSAAL
jgi:hypothetical protein